MKTIIILLALAVVAALCDLYLATAGLLLMALTLVLGDYFGEDLPPSACTHNCNQARACTCQPLKDPKK
jgi:hypothetical protein